MPVPASRRSIVSLRGLSVTLTGAAGAVEILRGIDLDLAAGETVSVVGPSGAGKTTLLMIIGGLERPSGGQVVVAGHDLRTLDEDGLARFRGRHVGIVFQSFHLIPTMTALENVAAPRELAGEADAFDRAREELAAVGLGHRLGHYPGELSGGEQQRVAIARALVNQPSLLLADEPTGNLDGATGAQVIDHLFARSRDNGATLVLITHERRLAGLCGRTIRMVDGRIEAQGMAPPDDPGRSGSRSRSQAGARIQVRASSPMTRCRPDPDRRRALRSASIRIPGAAPRRPGAPGVRDLSRLSRARGRGHRRGAVDGDLHRHRAARGRTGDPRGRSRPARGLPGPRAGRSGPPGTGRGGGHPLRGDAHHGPSAGRRRGGRARRAQGGGRPVSPVRPGRGARGRRRAGFPRHGAPGAGEPGGGRRGPRRRGPGRRGPGRRGSGRCRGMGSARGSCARRASGARRRGLPRHRRHHPRSAGHDRARARPGRLGRAFRLLAPGPGEPRCARRLRSRPRRQPRLPPVRAASGRGRQPGCGPGDARREVRGYGMADAHLRRRGAGDPAHGGAARLLPEPGRADRAAGRWGRGRQRGAGLARHPARGHRHPEVHRCGALDRLLHLSLAAHGDRGARGPGRARDRGAGAGGGGRVAREAAAHAGGAGDLSGGARHRDPVRPPHRGHVHAVAALPRP